MEIGFSLGSNLYDRKALLSKAKALLLSVPNTQFVAQSPLYETTPVGVKPEYQDMDYLNAVLILESDVSLSDWLAHIGEFEDQLGRVRTDDRNAPRPIDIDIIYAGDKIIDDGGLIVPHPRWAERRFVVQPLCDVRPGMIIPDSDQQPVAEILRKLPVDDGLSIFDEQW